MNDPPHIAEEDVDSVTFETTVRNGGYRVVVFKEVCLVFPAGEHRSELRGWLHKKEKRSLRATVHSSDPLFTSAQANQLQLFRIRVKNPPGIHHRVLVIDCTESNPGADVRRQGG